MDSDTATDGAEDRADAPTFSMITVTFARDEALKRSLAASAAVAGGRDDVEFILVDNNADGVDRSPWLTGFRRAKVVRLERNRGVAARNDGAETARGSILVFIDDDTELGPADALARYAKAFDDDPGLAIVTARHIDARTGRTPRACFPHTDKSRRQDEPFTTFRFQGNGFAIRRAAYAGVGPIGADFFYGLEEIDYAYAVIDAGWRIAYEPGIEARESNDPGGRRPKRVVEEMRLTNKMIISWKRMPTRYLAFNIATFSAYVFLLNGGRINPLASFAAFLRWVRDNPGRRRPIGAAAQAYIEKCGGDVWR